ncbi:Sugar phosphate isomerase/epimerase [Paracoccus halophilus]|uniref:Sugar phosphate isomerase/epimerase n=1 Tax=Paracoccus halophilus TaxID=376733 RepID=A0A099F5D8_9RHOB|nr:sugar phosphate isomerase/epimerase family protein [Paracoccus halophilus]KGJ05431.1 xylose isomerase [Paracoccus halophilus]SFA49207.1 Sugar phosphate isomerase/epimerase [Paracoccus halophilus]
MTKQAWAGGWTAKEWPIAAAMIPFPGQLPDGRLVQEAGPEAWADSLRQVAGAGFEAVDPTDSWLRVADLPAGARAEFVDICQSLGLAIPAISTSRRNLIDPDHGKAHLDYGHRVIDIAAELGVGHVSFGFFGPLTPEQQRVTWFWTEDGPRCPDDPDTYRLAIDRVRDLASHAQSCGIRVVLEMYEDTYLGTARDSVRFIEDVDHPSVKLNVDIGNLIRLHRPVEPWAEMIRLCAPFAGYWHVKNYYRMEDGRNGQIMTHPAPLLGGVINWRAAIETALDLGFDSPFLVEHYGGDGLGVCAQNRDYIRTILAGRRSRNDQAV